MKLQVRSLLPAVTVNHSFSLVSFLNNLSDSDSVLRRGVYMSSATLNKVNRRSTGVEEGNAAL